MKSRREFLKNAGFVLLSVQVLPLTRVLADSGEAEDGFEFQSGESNFLPLPGHNHRVKVAIDTLKNPAETGIKLKTTWAWLHFHSVELSKRQLEDLARGQVVTFSDTVGDHSYVCQLSTDQMALLERAQ